MDLSQLGHRYPMLGETSFTGTFIFIRMSNIETFFMLQKLKRNRRQKRETKGLPQISQSHPIPSTQANTSRIQRQPFPFSPFQSQIRFHSLSPPTPWESSIKPPIHEYRKKATRKREKSREEKVQPKKLNAQHSADMTQKKKKKTSPRIEQME
ncbi:hypothetical protein LI328DRAFT_25742 [Trichoderma asperelloides]|nr:hypothetical protein LI328DRAFT_25742 [Trichoderma asperelloides]